MSNNQGFFRPRFLITGILICFCALANAQAFVHPGIDQQKKDLDYMKKMVAEGRQPYKDAFDRLKMQADTTPLPKPHTHVLRGPFAKPNIGGDDLSKASSLAYNAALVWYITGNKVYADKAIAVLNAWPPVLWDFDYNDAKLLAAWTGHQLCNAAEILKYTNAGWAPADIKRFSGMMMTVYYPLLRFYYTQANGNWDGAIIHSLLAIGIFTDNRKIFDNAVDHFLHAPFNGSLLKYVYQGGQCQETPRDHGHVQLGLGEFAGAAQVAFTQGVDLFAIGDNRLAQAFEYEAKILFGEKVQCYCDVSERAKSLREDYEVVYRHYSARGYTIPFTERAADSVRPKAGRSVLAAVRVPIITTLSIKPLPVASVGYVAGAESATTPPIPANALIVEPGQSIQSALDNAAGTGRWVWLKKGLHTYNGPLKIPSGVTICGEGKATVLFADPAHSDREAMINADSNMHDVTIRDLVIEASNKSDVPTDPNSIRSFRGGYNRGGILFRGLAGSPLRHLRFEHLTVRNGTYTGILVSGAEDVQVIACDLAENGVSVPPGPALLHNMYLSHSKNITIRDSRMVNSPYGSGIALDGCEQATITNCEIARNGFFGVLLSESSNVKISKCLVEANDRSGIMAEWLHNGCSQIIVQQNTIQYNNGFGTEMHAATNSQAHQNLYRQNGKQPAQESISTEKIILQND